MAKRRRCKRILALAVTAAFALAVVVLIVLRHHRPGPESAQALSCPDVMVVSIPGTWESSPQQDPTNPTQFPNALLLNVTRSLATQFGTGRLQVYTVPYVAQFHRPLSGDNEVDYDVSRRQGTDATRNAIAEVAGKCPLTGFVIVGFSQGAVIGGDIASDIGNGRGPVASDRVLGVTLIADGRREPGIGHDIGPKPAGEGAEITLRSFPFIPAGMTMTGGRSGGFGALTDRTNEICAQGDLICAAPSDAFDPLNLPGTIKVLLGGAGQPVHALYNTTQFWSLDGRPATVWTRDWAANVIAAAPHPVRHG
ncbi:MAG: cutinase family protein [Mycobacteriaceae bacterium]|nr:cutinase family protein [Mycobacteriaceae bacterium]